MSTNTSSLHVFQILRLVAEAREPQGVAEIARSTGLPTTTVYRALVTLTQARFLARDEGTAKYRIGHQPLVLLRALFNRFPIRELALPALRALAADTGETVSLSARIGWYGVRVASAPGSRDTQYKPRVGLSQLLHRSRVQTLMLASLPDAQVQAYRRFVRKHYPEFGAEVDKAAFGKELRATAERGWATTPALLGTGHHFALPLRLASGQVAAILHINGPVVDDAEPAVDARIKRWLRIRDGVEKLLQEDEDRYQDPFVHVPADEILMRISA